uniref:Uncharacterized protein n=1 Tax=Promethearchaeum syntrophicum TaxID=2594042 RepID=A0A5B9DDS3_9ARCH|nr:hypothetical protein DSAG12_03074 [Candidatus Prometheoarchaeum syntrophicum]
MKEVSKKVKKLTETNKKILKDQPQNSFSAKQKIKIENENQELSPIALMRHRIEEMNRKLLEKRNQGKMHK